MEVLEKIKLTTKRLRPIGVALLTTTGIVGVGGLVYYLDGARQVTVVTVTDRCVNGYNQQGRIISQSDSTLHVLYQRRDIFPFGKDISGWTVTTDDGVRRLSRYDTDPDVPFSKYGPRLALEGRYVVRFTSIDGGIEYDIACGGPTGALTQTGFDPYARAVIGSPK